MNETSYLIKLNKLIKQRSDLQEKLEGITYWKRIIAYAEEKAIKDSITHWKRMIAYAKQQPVGAYPSEITMRKAIGESWTGFDCPLCNLYTDECKPCPLSVQNKCPPEWYNVANANTWEEWAEEAHEMLALLEKIREKEEKRNELHR